MTTPGVADLPDDKPLVLVVVGTDHHPFDRVVAWMDRWRADHPSHHCLVQYGTSSPPRICTGVDYLGYAELQARMRQAVAVVSHGGPGTIMEVRSAGLKPVVVARDPSRGEHVDGHQQRFVKVMSSRDFVREVATEDDLRQELGAALVRARDDDRQRDGVVRGAAAAARFGELAAPLITGTGVTRDTQWHWWLRGRHVT